MNKQQREYILNKAYTLLNEKRTRDCNVFYKRQTKLKEDAIKNKTCFVIYPEGDSYLLPSVGFPGMETFNPPHAKLHPAYIKLEETLLFETSIDINAILAPITALCQQDSQ